MRIPPKISFDAFRDLRALYVHLLEHSLLVVEDWAGNEADFVKIGQAFGVLERPSQATDQHGGALFRVTSTGTDNVGVGRYWHSDGFAHTLAPALITLYHVAVGVKASAGTAFVDGCMAWNSLDRKWQEQLEGRYWTHISGSRHLIVRTHHALGVPVLSINLGKVSTIDGMDSSRIKSTIEYLGDILDRSSGYLHEWEKGDLLIVDNRRLLHRAPLNIVGERVLWRVSVIASTLADQEFPPCQQQ